MKRIPIKQNQVLDLHITSINSQGQGVGKVDGFVIFVPGALPGEDCKVKIDKILSKYAVGILLSRDNDSKLRTKPKCRYFGKCGGCQLQHIKYQGQLLIKQKNIMDILKRIGNKAETKVLPTIGMESPWYYRNKVVFNTSKHKGDGVIGLFQSHSHRVVPIDHCYIINKPLNSILPAVNAFLKFLHAKEDAFHMPFSRVFGRMGSDGQMMVGTVGKDEIHSQYESLVVNLRRSHNDIVSIFHNRTDDPSGNLSRDNTYLWGKHTIDGNIGKLKFEISPNSFFQVNTKQTNKLYDVIKDYCNLTGEEIVFDAYCGVGTIGMYVAKDAKKVYGIESISASINNARENAKNNNIRNMEFYAGDCERVFPQLIDSDIIPDIMIVDPPRKGCSNGFVNAMCKAKPKKIVYVSCNPATMARDLKAICAKGYEVDKVQPVDMFGHTTHVECVVGLYRKD